MKKYGSRKFIISLIQLVLLAGLPILYHYIGISDDLCKIVIFGTLGNSIYHVVNIFDGRMNGTDQKAE